ncbi:signal peptidase complex subunit 1-like [Saccostrea cucullata]|uniref:signal peptidase complex subunit 1-like n=1 Tax=Saccostrea echinata TaxID=191078 RepID=UPI002A7FE034|nr:signal peptidase complex subunit 1-like [Saccostrea echinata]
MDLTQFLPEKFKKIPCHMDYEGQKRAEQLFQVIIVLFGVVGFIWGYICQQFSQTMYILLAGFALSCILTLPPWPMFRRKPLQWQKARPEPAEDSGKDSTSSSSQSSQKSKKKK